MTQAQVTMLRDYAAKGFEAQSDKIYMRGVADQFVARKGALISDKSDKELCQAFEEWMGAWD